MNKTPRQKALARALIENATSKNPAGISDTLEAFGYARTTARHAQQTIIQSKGVQEELKPFLDKLKEERDAIIKDMSKKRKSANYSDLVRGLDVTIKNLQLLSGGDTGRVTVIDKIEMVNPK